MTNSTLLATAAGRLIASAESFRSHVYDDATGETLCPGYTLVGNATIGYGRMVGLDGPGITLPEALVLRNNSQYTATIDASYAIGQKWNALDLARQAALVDLAYEMGRTQLLGFHEMLYAIQSGDWEAASAQLLNSEYAKQVPSRAKRDAAILATGVLPP